MMLTLSEIKKLDEETLGKLTEGKGPADECLCKILSPPPTSEKGIKSSLKKILGKGGKGKKRVIGQGQTLEIPLTKNQAGYVVKAGKQVIKHKGSCGKCGCDENDVVVDHSVATIRIVTPDISNFCPCPTHDCLPESSRDKFKNNISVTIERVETDPDTENSETSIHTEKDLLEPPLYKRSITSLINAQYETEEDRLL